MKLSFCSIFLISFILAILIGCVSAEKTKEIDSTALVNRGIDFGNKGQFDRTIAFFNEALELNPKNERAYNNRRLVYYYEGKHAEACSDWRWACELGLCKNYELAIIKGVCL